MRNAKPGVVEGSTGHLSSSYWTTNRRLMMNLYQCEAKAQEIGSDKARFVALFPCGPVQCQWIDAYFGMFKADVDGLRDGFLTTKQVDEEYPDLFCSEPYVDEHGN